MTPFLDGLARLEAEATPGPWARPARFNAADAAFIAAFRNAALRLIEVARAAAELVEENRSIGGGVPAKFITLDSKLAALRAETERST